MAPQEIPVDPRQHAHHAIAAAGEEDGAEIGVGGEAMEGVETLGVLAGEQPVAGAQIIAEIVGEHRLEAEPPEGLDAAVEPFRIDGAREGRDPHPVAGTGGRRELGGGDQSAGDLRKPSSVSRRERR